jgi:transposase
MDYGKLKKKELIEVILQLQDELIELRKQLQGPHKNSSNSSKPPSSDFPKRNGSLREKSGKKSGGQIGHMGKTRPLVATPDVLIDCRPETCVGCGKSLLDKEGAICGKEQVIDIPPIVPVITQYNQIQITCVCGTNNSGVLPHRASGVIRIGENIRSFVSYLNVYHHMPYDRLTVMFSDILKITVNEGTIGTILSETAEKGTPLYREIQDMVNTTSYRGSDETGVRVMGKTWWEWVWQNVKASYYHINTSRGYAVVEENMPEEYEGVHIADCWSAQNNTKAKYHQLCHEHLKRDLKYLIETIKSRWAYQMYTFLCKSRKARDHLWEKEETIRNEGIILYRNTLDQLLKIAVPTKKEKTLMKRFVTHKEKILTFMDYKDVPPDNNTSEQAIRKSKIKMKVSGGFRSEQGAKNYAVILSIIETCKKQHMNILQAIQDLLRGVDISLQFTT